LYRLTGDTNAANRQFARVHLTCSGPSWKARVPGPAVSAALPRQ
jgi:hypothetical protein